MATLDKQIFIQQVTKDSEAEGGIITTDQLQTIILNNLKNFDMVRENNGRVSLDYLEAFINAKFIEGRTHKTLKRYANSRSSTHTRSRKDRHNNGICLHRKRKRKSIV